MEYTLEALQTISYDKACQVYDIFKDFFGEDNVDFQGFDITDYLPYDKMVREEVWDISEKELGCLKTCSATAYCSIMVHWPKVTVTNENDRSVDIEDLYARIDVRPSGRLPETGYAFKLIRSTFSVVQFSSQYVHSHVPSLDYQHLDRFLTPCLGSGPINRTISTLIGEFDETFWLLFCQELDAYVTVESLRGGPYRKLEEIGRYSYRMPWENKYQPLTRGYKSLNNLLLKISKDDVKVLDFVKYYLKHCHIHLGYSEGQYHINEPFYYFLIDVSNAFIQFFNEGVDKTQEAVGILFSKNYLRRLIYANNVFYRSEQSLFACSEYIGKHVCYFKGQDVTLQIHGEAGGEEKLCTVMEPFYANTICYLILTTINYLYNERDKEIFNRDAASTGQKLLCI